MPRQGSTGGKAQLGKISKMGQRDLRRLLITGAMSTVRWAVRRGATKDPWLARMLARKPRMLVAIRRMSRRRRRVFAFLCDPSVDATNWRAEQAIRRNSPAVVTRNVGR